MEKGPVHEVGRQVPCSHFWFAASPAGPQTSHGQRPRHMNSLLFMALRVSYRFIWTKESALHAVYIVIRSGIFKSYRTRPEGMID